MQIKDWAQLYVLVSISLGVIDTIWWIVIFLTILKKEGKEGLITEMKENLVKFGNAKKIVSGNKTIYVAITEKGETTLERLKDVNIYGYTCNVLINKLLSTPIYWPYYVWKKMY